MKRRSKFDRRTLFRCIANVCSPVSHVQGNQRTIRRKIFTLSGTYFDRPRPIITGLGDIAVKSFNSLLFSSLVKPSGLF